jgi:hypothetical protein
VEDLGANYTGKSANSLGPGEVCEIVSDLLAFNLGSSLVATLELQACITDVRLFCCNADAAGYLPDRRKDVTFHR